MTLHEIIQDIHGLDVELAQLERCYGLLSADFYHLYKAGELEQSRDFIRWVGYYEAKLEREARYREMMYVHLRELREKTGLRALQLIDTVADRHSGVQTVQQGSDASRAC